MEPLPDIKLVGLVIGKIILNAPPLVYSLYITPDGKHYRSTREWKNHDHSTDVALSLVCQNDTAVLARFTNSYIPRWHYLQFSPRYGPRQLKDWDLPIAVYSEPWTKHGLL